MNKKYSQKNFYMNRKGPWPQPSPIHPWGEAPAVIKLPLREKVDWWIFIGIRYIFTLLLTPLFLIKAILKPGLKPVSDTKFNWFFNKSMFSKFLSKKFDSEDEYNFSKPLEDNHKDWYIVDFSAVKSIKTKNNIYCSASKVLLFKKENVFFVECIYIQNSDQVFFPSDGDAWELAKYFVLQGGALCSTLVTHPNQHFPVDSINAIIKTSIPTDHTLYRLFKPHLRFTLALENAVLNYKSSLLKDRWWMVYAPFPGDSDGLRDLLREGYKGIKGNASYPPFSYPMNRPNLESDYGIYLEKYYDVIYKFIEEVIVEIPENDIWTIRFADYVNKYVNDFPSGDMIFKDNNLQRALTSYLYTITVSHAVDHYNFGTLDKREVPLRIRQEPPTTESTMIPRKKLCNIIDLMKYYTADTLFFKPWTVTSLIKTKYKFKYLSQKNAVINFKANLIKAEADLLEQNIRYMPLKKITASIQS